MAELNSQQTEITIFRLSGIDVRSLDIRELKTELVRKSLHFLIALSPSLAAINHFLTVAALMAGVLLYTYMEGLRLLGREVPLISSLTNMASRPRDKGHFILGPVTLGIGALLALLLYPFPAASIAIYALAFGDGLASLVGKVFGRIRPAFLMGKSVEGSLACFSAVFFVTYHISHDYKTAFVAAVIATVVEAFPLKDYDNLAMPIAVGFAVQFMAF